MATLKDVAALAGVSLSTVSIVAKGQGDARKISAATQAKVRDAMAELGYVPNAAARRLRGGDARKSVALFWADDFREAMLARFLKGLHAAIDELGVELDISVVIYKTGSLGQVSALKGAPVFNAAIVANANAADLQFLSDYRPLVPTVLYNRELEGYASVAVNDSEVGWSAAHEVVRFIQERQGEDTAFAAALNDQAAPSVVAYLSAPYAFEGMKLRERAFVEELELAGIRAEGVPITESSASAGRAATKELLNKGFRVVFTPSDAVALGVLNACYEHGIRVPESLAVLAVGNGLPEYAEHACPALSRIEIPMERMAGECLKLIATKLGITVGAPIQTSVPPSTIRRQSL